MKAKLLLVLALCLYLIPVTASNTTLPPTVTISYNSPFCSNSTIESVIINGTGNFTGGTYSASPAGLAIDPATGSITLVTSIAGIYLVTYTIPAGVDPEVQATTTVQILSVPTAGSDGGTTVCDSSTSVIDLASLIFGEQAGGVWTRTTGTGGTFNAAIGTYIPSFGATSSTFTYTIAGSWPCLNDTSTATVSVNQQPYAGYGSTLSVCNTDGTAINLFDLVWGEQPGGIWTRTSGTGGAFNISGVFIPEPGNTTSSTFAYTVNGTPPCIDDTVTVAVNIGSEITIPGNFPNITECTSYVLPPLQMGNYFTEPGGTGQMLPSGTEIFWSQMIYVYAESGTCTGEESFFVTINLSGVPTFTPVPPQCLDAEPIQLPSMSTNGIVGTWSPIFNPSILGTTIYTFTPDQQFCSVPVTMEITVVSCAGIKLNAFLDINSNGLEDNGEPKFPLGHFNYEANDSGIVRQGTAPNGIYTITDIDGNSSYDVTYSLDTEAGSLYNITTSYTNIVADNPYPVYNFPVTVLQTHTDIQVTLVPSVAPRHGFTYQNEIVYSNMGNTVITGSLSFVKDPLLSILSVSESGITNTATGFTYEFGSLLPFESRSMTVVMQVPVIPNVSIGQLLTNSVAIANTQNTVSDSHSLTQAIIGSYDPNDKNESHGEEILFSGFTSDDYLFYTIRFENTGNANAETVRITDNLDSSLDENSVRLIGASHDYTLERTESNLVFHFADIQLPPSVANTEIGKGYVMFKVKPKPGYAVGDIIPNQASIYFDFNPAIETNTFQTKFVNQLATATFNNAVAGFFPNPASDQITVFTNGNHTVKAIAIYDLLGKEILKQNGNGKVENVNLRTLANGMYILDITASDDSKTIKKLLVK